MTIVKFGDVVHEVKNNIDRENNPYEYYVAGDHMDSENLKISRRGIFATDDVGPAFIRLFKPGQILYGSRRTYLKKVAVADFEGITSNTTFVLETKDEEILSQKFLPFLMLSDRFTDYSIKKSKGSTNPYILFSDLAEYEFDLPPIEEQKRLAEILWAAEDLKERYMNTIKRIDTLLHSTFIEMFGNPVNNTKSLPYLRLDEICEKISDGSHNIPNAIKSSNYFMLSSKNIFDDCITYDEPRFISERDFEIENKRTNIQTNDLLLTIVGTIGRVTIVPELHPNFVLQRSVAVLRPKKEIVNPIFLKYELIYLREKLEDLAHGVAQKGIYLGKLSSINIVLPSIDRQQYFVYIVQQLELIKTNILESVSIIKNITNKINNS